MKTKTIELTLDIDELECDFEFQPYERQTLEHPGCAESSTLISCKFRGVEIIDLLVDGDIEYITEFYEERATDGKLDAQISAYEDRKNRV